MLYTMDLLSSGCFAFIGTQAAKKAGISSLGIFISAILSATGGGTIREVLLRSETVFWLQDISYVVAVTLGLAAALLLTGTGYRRRVVIESVDCLSTTVFVVVGVCAAIQAQCHWFFVPVMGVLTGLGGGITREVIFNGRSNILMNENLTRSVFVISVVATIAVYLKVHLAIVLGVLSSIHLVSIFHFQKSALRTEILGSES